MMRIEQYDGPGTLERAIEIAARAHEGARDKGGSPYILHPLRVMMRQDTDEARMAAVLHDVVEDTDITLEDLRGKAGLPEAVLRALELVTMRKDGAGENLDTYEEFIERCAADPVARAVKLADLEDNLDARWLGEFDAAAAERFAKYLRRYRRLAEIDK